MKSKNGLILSKKMTGRVDDQLQHHYHEEPDLGLTPMRRAFHHQSSSPSIIPDQSLLTRPLLPTTLCLTTL